MVNSQYPKQVSRSTRSAKIVKAQNGKFVGSYAPYGLDKDPADKNHLITAEDAPIVFEIFQRTAQGETARQIADDLNARGIITPSMRIFIKYNKPGCRLKVCKTWSSCSITNMLDNVAYIGHMQQCKRENIGYKGKKRRVTGWNERITVENTHEAIIPLALWNAVQEKRANKPKVQKMQRTGVNLFSGFVRCNDCGRVLSPVTDKGILR